jgi:glycine cleavage system aminomethyltransferase T
LPPSTKRNIALARVRRPCQAKGKLMVEVYALREL